MILGISGDPANEDVARAAGADDFLVKPVASIVLFQNKILSLLPSSRRPAGPREIINDKIKPDPLSLRDDLTAIGQVLSDRDRPGGADYAVQFLSSVAYDSGDRVLEEAANGLRLARRDGRPEGPATARLSAVIQDRIAATPPL